MITIDSSRLQASLRRFNAACAVKAESLKKAGWKVVIVEAQRLVNTLIKFTPPRDRQVSGERIQKQVESRFSTLGNAQSGNTQWETYSASKKAGHGEVRWYAWSPGGLYGVARDADKTQAGAEDLYDIYLHSRVGKSGRVLGSRGKQRVFIRKKITTNPATRAKVVKRIQKHLGRLKAGWLVAWAGLGGPTRFNPPSEWVRKHAQGARGSKVDNLGDRNNPSFTLINRAVGVGSAKNNMAGIVAAALETRHTAMGRRMVFLIEHPEKINEDIE